MVNYDEICVFCNGEGETLPEDITADMEESTLILRFSQFLHRLMKSRGVKPHVAYPTVEAYASEAYTKLIQQWYTKRREENDDEVTITLRWETKANEKIFDVTSSFERIMTFTDILGSTSSHDERLVAVRKWLVEEGHYTPSKMTKLQILTDDKVLDIII